MNIIFTRILAHGKSEDVNKFVSETIGYVEEAERVCFKFDAIVPKPYTAGMDTEAHIDAYKKTWGCWKGPFSTKYSTIKNGDLVTANIYLETGWCPPIHILEKLPEKYPCLKFNALYWNDDEISDDERSIELLVDALVGENAADTSGKPPTIGCVRNIIHEMHSLIETMAERIKNESPECSTHPVLFTSVDFPDDLQNWYHGDKFKELGLADDEIRSFIRELGLVSAYTDIHFWCPEGGVSPSEETLDRNRNDHTEFLRSVKRRIPALRMFTDMDVQPESASK